MKKNQDFKFLFVAVATLLVLSMNADQLFAQKNKIRLNADFVNIQAKEQFLNIKASARIDKQTVEVSNVELTILEISDDQERELGKTMTDAGGKSKFVIKEFESLKPDSTGSYHLSIEFAGNDMFQKASKELSFKKATFVTNLITRDSTNYLTAKLIDAKTDSVITDIPLAVQVERLFRPLKIGKDFYMTDDNGEIEVAIEDGIPGIDRNLTLEVVLNENEDYGTIKASIKAPIGKDIVRESTFNQRTMWSPRGKTPLFLLFLTFSFIIIVWGIFVYLLRNLFKIVKS